MTQPEQRASRQATRSHGATATWTGKRPTLWRLPLIAFLATGILCLKYLDGRLRSDYRKSAADLAVQADALIESAVAYRAASVHELRLLLAGASTASEQRSRLNVFAHAFADANPDLHAGKKKADVPCTRSNNRSAGIKNPQRPRAPIFPPAIGNPRSAIEPLFHSVFHFLRS